MTICDERIVFGVRFTYADSWSYDINVTHCNCGNSSEELNQNPHSPGDESKTNYYPGDKYDYFAVTLAPWDAALESDRHPLFKVWKKALISEIPKLIQNSNISSELKPEIKFIEIIKTEGGFISGHYEITFKRPHWDNADRFQEAMDEVCSLYKQRPAEEGVFGDVFDGFVKHDYQDHRMKPWKKKEPKPEKEANPKDEGDGTDGEEGSGEPEPNSGLKARRKEDTSARWAALPVAIIILGSVFGYLIFKTEACMCRTWCNLGAKEAV